MTILQEEDAPRVADHTDSTRGWSVKSAVQKYANGLKKLDEINRQLDDLERTRPSYVTGR